MSSVTEIEGELHVKGDIKSEHIVVPKSICFETNKYTEYTEYTYNTNYIGYNYNLTFAYDEQYYVAIIGGGAYYTLRSDPSSLTKAFDRYVTFIAYGNGYWMFIDSTTCYYTSDITSGNITSVTLDGGKKHGIRFVNGMFHIIGNGITTSVDDPSKEYSEWIKKGNGLRECYDITYGNNMYVLVGYDKSVLYTNDLVNDGWNQGNFTAPISIDYITFHNGYFILGNTSETIYTSDFLNFETFSKPNGMHNTYVIYSDGEYLWMGSSNGIIIYMKSITDTSYSTITTNVNNKIYAIYRSNNHLITWFQGLGLRIYERNRYVEPGRYPFGYLIPETITKNIPLGDIFAELPECSISYLDNYPSQFYTGVMFKYGTARSFMLCASKYSDNTTTSGKSELRVYFNNQNYKGDNIRPYDKIGYQKILTDYNYTDYISQTITHRTGTSDKLLLGLWCSADGSIYTDAEQKNSMTNCICNIKISESLSANVVGIVSSIDPPNFATHGDCLIDITNINIDDINVGTILVPAENGLSKIGSKDDIMSCIMFGIPLAKVTSKDLIDGMIPVFIK